MLWKVCSNEGLTPHSTQITLFCDEMGDKSVSDQEIGYMIVRLIF
jgi:hypothetical protein